MPPHSRPFRSSPGITAMLLAAVIVVSTPTSGAAQSGGASRERDLVRAIIEQYFKGHATGQAAEMRLAFLPSAHIEGIRSGRFSSQPAETYVANFRGNPAADEAKRTRRIDVIDVTGTAAMAKATLVHGATTFTDYFVLLKVDGQWKIANKVYHAERE